MCYTEKAISKANTFFCSPAAGQGFTDISSQQLRAHPDWETQTQHYQSHRRNLQGIKHVEKCGWNLSNMLKAVSRLLCIKFLRVRPNTANSKSYYGKGRVTSTWQLRMPVEPGLPGTNPGFPGRGCTAKAAEEHCHSSESCLTLHFLKCNIQNMGKSKASNLLSSTAAFVGLVHVSKS